MKKLGFDKVSILSDHQKIAAQFRFSSRFNLIVSKNKNSVGKSSIVKSIFWALGCDPRFDDKWKGLDTKVLVEFHIEERKYWIARHGNRMFLSLDGRKYKSYPKITGDYAKDFSKIVNFNALLQKRNEEAIETPPPAYYFVPFYIDQKKSWSTAWDSFGGLGQYSDWKKEIIPYHTGMTNKSYFETTDRIYSNRRDKKKLDEEIGRIDTAMEVVTEFVPPTETTVDLNELEDIRNELQKDLFELHEKQENLFEMIASHRAEKAHIESQLRIAVEVVDKLHHDYEFASSLDDELECPTCGVVHDNSLVNRFSILEDKDNAEQVVERLQNAIINIESSLKKHQESLADVRDKIGRLNKKYYREEKNTVFNLQNILDSTASHSVRRNVNSHRKEKIERLHEVETETEKLSKLRKSQAQKHRNNVNKDFRALFPSYTNRLRAFGVNSESIKSPLSHNKVADSGGAAECSRAMLAYYLAVYKLIYKYGEEVLSPLVIDTPNQHEQAVQHYQKIVELISSESPSISQIFFCGMDSPNLDPLKKVGRTILLEKEHQLLTKDHYSEVQQEIGGIFELTPED